MHLYSVIIGMTTESNGHMAGSVAQSDAGPTDDQEVASSVYLLVKGDF